MKLFSLIFTLSCIIFSCADILVDEALKNPPTSGIVGFWFGCEFGSGEISCRFFDDDGLQFTKDGSVFSIETFISSPDPGCNSHACFDSFRPSIIIDRELVGSYIYSDSTLIFNPYSDTICTENLTWNSEISFFRDFLSLCSSWGLSFLYFKKYAGEVFFN